MMKSNASNNNKHKETNGTTPTHKKSLTDENTRNTRSTAKRNNDTPQNEDHYNVEPKRALQYYLGTTKEEAQPPTTMPQRWRNLLQFQHLKEDQQNQQPMNPQPTQRHQVKPNQTKQSKPSQSKPRPIEVVPYQYTLDMKVRHLYETGQFAECDYNMTLVHPYKSDAGKIKLKVGTKIIVKHPMMINKMTTSVCIDFKRDGIIAAKCDGIIAGGTLYSFIAVDDLNNGLVFDNGECITSARQLWVKRNPSHTRTIINDMLEQWEIKKETQIRATEEKIKSLQKANIDSLQEAKKVAKMDHKIQDEIDALSNTNIMEIDTLRDMNSMEIDALSHMNSMEKQSPLPDFPTVNGCLEQGEDEDFRRLIDLPRNLPLQAFMMPTCNSEDYVLQNNQRECFICGDIIKVNQEHVTQPWADIHDVQVDYDKQEMKAHCAKRHPGQMFHFLVKGDRIDTKDSFDVKQAAQRLLRISLNVLGPNIAFSYFESIKNEENSIGLICFLKMIMGSALVLVRSNQESTLLKSRACVKSRGKEWSNEADKIFVQKVENVLKEINWRLEKFDWVSLGKLVTAFQLWNATNLFLKRGLFDETLFPPVLGLPIPNFNVYDAMMQAKQVEGQIQK